MFGHAPDRAQSAGGSEKAPAFHERVNRRLADRQLVQAANRTPAFWQARFELAKLYYQTERFEAVLKELKAALDCAPNPEEAARTHGLMAVAYSRLGRHEEARLAAAAAEK